MNTVIFVQDADELDTSRITAIDLRAAAEKGGEWQHLAWLDKLGNRCDTLIDLTGSGRVGIECGAGAEWYDSYLPPNGEGCIVIDGERYDYTLNRLWAD